MLTPIAHGKEEVMKMPIVLLDALSRKEQTLISTATNKSRRLSGGSTTILENSLTMETDPVKRIV